MNAYTTLPATLYHDPDIYQAERQSIFKSEWLLFGHENMLKDPGSYISQSIAGWPIFVIRGNDGELKGFHNVCRHRAAPLLNEGTGKAAALRCPYHGWLYDTDGKLRKTPDYCDEKIDICERIALFLIHVKLWNHLVFVCLADTPPDFISALGDLIDVAQDTDLSNFHFHSTDAHKLGCNWKTYVENYMEGYHIPFVHPELNKEVDMKTYKVLPQNRIARHVSEPRADRKEDAINDGLWVWHWPYAALNVYKTGMNLELMIPTGPQTMELRYYYLFHDLGDGSTIKNTIDMSKTVTQEDIDICEAVQKNLAGGIYETGELSPKHEMGVKYFQDLVRDTVK